MKSFSDHSKIANINKSAQHENNNNNAMTLRTSFFIIQLEIDWRGEDKESGIYGYQLGIGHVGSGQPDLLPYTSTHGHQHYVNYHPHLADATWFDLHINVRNKAGMQTHKVK